MAESASELLSRLSEIEYNAEKIILEAENSARALHEKAGREADALFEEKSNEIKLQLQNDYEKQFQTLSADYENKLASYKKTLNEVSENKKEFANLFSQLLLRV